ncbi:MAG: peptidyl-prolyl cis-trans isomerase [Nibricoccus sp.]
MISWIQKTFQQHFRIVFAVLLVLIIISFIFITNASSGLRQADHQVVKRPYLDLNIGRSSDQQRLLGDTEDTRRIMGDAMLSLEIEYGQMPFRSQQQLEGYALTRYTCLHLANQLNVPSPNKAELADYIKGLNSFAGSDGQFDAGKYAEFRKTIAANKAVTEGQISRILSDNLRIERVTKLIAGPGYTLPADVKRELTLFDTTWTLATASIDRASFAPAITPTDAEIAKLFEENAPAYTIPAQVSVSYVEFTADSFLAALPTPPEADVRGFYDNNAARFPVADRKPGETANPDADYAKVRPQVEATLKQAAAKRVASKVAGDVALTLYEKKITPLSADFPAFLAANKLTLKNVPPFSEENVPAELGANPAIPAEALKLNKDRMVSDAIPTEKGSVILFWKDSFASRQPSLSEVRAKVTADFIENEKAKRFIALGQSLRTQIQVRLKAGDSFRKSRHRRRGRRKCKS